MKRVLIITYYWPPSGGPGVQRALYFVKYLRQYGWEPVVYTVKDGEYPILDHSLQEEVPDGIEVFRKKAWEPYSIYKSLKGKNKEERLAPTLIKSKSEKGFIHKFSVWIRGNFFIPDARKFWIRPSINYLVEYLKKHPVDAILSTSPPQSLHLIGMGVKEKTGIPWLADFRDPWTGVSFYEDLMLMKFADRKHKLLEKKVLKSADRVVTVSKKWAEDLENIGDRKVDVIGNGFDPPEEIPERKKIGDTIVMSFVGSLSGNRNPEQLWSIVKSLIEKEPEIYANLKIQLIGNIDPFIRDFIIEIGLEKIVEFPGYIAHDELFKYYAQSDILLLIGIPNVQGVVTGKVFEYLFMQKPILSIGAEGGEIDAILKKTGAGLHSNFSNKERVSSNFIKIFNVVKSGDITEYQTDDSILDKFTRNHLTGKLTHLLDKMIES